MSRNSLLILLLGLTSLSASAQKNKIIHVLIVDGFNNHDWKQTITIPADFPAKDAISLKSEKGFLNTVKNKTAI